MARNLSSVHTFSWSKHKLFRAMEYNYSTLWISLLNSVFASIAFIVWYSLGKEENSYKQPKIKEEIKIVEIEEEPQEDTEEERHLYIKDGKFINYPELYLRRNDEEEFKEIQPKPAEKEKKAQRETSVASEKELTTPFQWPRQDDVIEKLRSKQTENADISADLKMKLQDAGILRSGPALDDNSRLSTRAQTCGRQIPRKQIFVGFDKFESVSRPGLEHSSSPEGSPCPAKTKLVMRRVNMEADRGRKQGYRRTFTTKVRQQDGGNNLVRTM